METIKIKYLRNIEPIESVTNGDWIDLRCAEDITVYSGQYKMIPLGVAMELPEGYEAIIVPRSSTFKKYHLLQANSVGVVDESYCGNEDEWMFPVYYPSEALALAVDIPKNTRICQFRIVKHQPDINFETVTELNSTNRGGFGSTGEM